ncbi:Non-specific lipid-transfer protein 1 [Platanthera guangdongensis]|uniref:Non-specific lipid-transfer protein n=1 Tax=Platanthera guangdongensis TaxID=2320717 RepID=A0ABR2LS68_9ASPA
MVSPPAAVALAAALVAAAVMLPSSKAALSCTTVYQSLYPCLSYLQSGGSGVQLEQCCSGIYSLKEAAGTMADRREACTCLKAAAESVSGVNLNLAGALPKICGVNIPFKISTSTDCSKVASSIKEW